MRIFEIEEGREETYIPIKLNLSDEDAATLIEIGRQRIQVDQNALLEYAVRSLLEDKIKGAEVEFNISEIIELQLDYTGETENGTDDNG